MLDQEAGRSGRPRRILIVDDEENVTLTLQRGLKVLPNCEIATATGAQQALELFAQRSFDLLITDYRMSGMDGIALAARVQELYPGTATIIITGYGSQMLHRQAAGTSIRRILEKPVKLTEIRTVASEALAVAYDSFASAEVRRAKKGNGIDAMKRVEDKHDGD
jgi:DNA-binding NtrC family response regulator